MIEESVIGQKFGKVTIIKEVPRRGKNKSRAVLGECECGNKKEFILRNLKKGYTTSCGCFHKQVIKKVFGTHLLRKHPLYRIRTGMLTRCTNENEPCYKNYGGRGITVCEEWRTDFLSFYNWAIENNWEKGLEIDRINNDGNYEPMNCRFVSRKQNTRNRRSTVMLKYLGETKAMSEWAEIYKIDLRLLWSRLFVGNWSLEDALTKKKKVSKHSEETKKKMSEGLKLSWKKKKEGMC